MISPGLPYGGSGKRQITLQAVIAALLGGTSLSSSVTTAIVTPLNLFIVPNDPASVFDAATAAVGPTSLWNAALWNAGDWAA